jgi:hypothetical protein
MRLLWTFVKVVLALALIVPLGIIAAATALGVLGALVGLAILALKIAVVGLVAWGAFSLLRALLRSGRPRRAEAPVVRELPPVDPHYAAAMRELDRELGTTG